MKILFITFALLFSAIAAAGLPHFPEFTWTPPAEFTNGEPLDAATDLEHFKLYCSGAANIELTISSDLTSYVSDPGTFIAGPYTCAMTAVANSANGGMESASSNERNFIVGAKSPGVIDFGVVQ